MGSELERRLREAGPADVDGLLALGCDLFDGGRLRDAERCFRRGVELGSATAAFDLGNCLVELGRQVEAVEQYEVALAGGVVEAWLNLGYALSDLGDRAGATRAFEQAEAAGDPGGPLALAFELREDGDTQAALAAARRAVQAGHPAAAAVIACWLWCSSLDPGLEDALRAGADVFAPARADLGDLLRSAGRLQQARDVLEAGAARGEVESMIALGNLLADDFHDPVAAEAAYRAAADLGDAHAHHNLAVLLEQQGDLDGAEHHYQRAIDGGDTLAIAALQELLAE